jgi:hypothetical protein
VRRGRSNPTPVPLNAHFRRCLREESRPISGGEYTRRGIHAANEKVDRLTTKFDVLGGMMARLPGAMKTLAETATNHQRRIADLKGGKAAIAVKELGAWGHHTQSSSRVLP